MSIPATAFVYAIGHSVGPQKVGYSTNPRSRLHGIKRDAGDERLVIQGAFPVAQEWAIHAERMAHWLLREHHFRNEWFNCSPAEAAAAVEQAASMHYDGADYVPTVTRPNALYDEQITLRLIRGTFAQIESVVGSRDRSDFIRTAITEALERREKAEKAKPWAGERLANKLREHSGESYPGASRFSPFVPISGVVLRLALIATSPLQIRGLSGAG